MSVTPNPVLLATIGGPHGIKGEVRVKAFTDDPLAVGDYGALRDTENRKFKIMRLRPAGGKNPAMLVVKFKGINSRSEAQALNGIELFISRTALPDDNEEDEFYVADLVGCDVFDHEDKAIGTIVAVPDFGAGPLLEIALTGTSATQLLEFSRANVPEVELAERKVRIVPPEEVSEREPE